MVPRSLFDDVDSRVSHRNIHPLYAAFLFRLNYSWVRNIFGICKKIYRPKSLTGCVLAALTYSFPGLLLFLRGILRCLLVDWANGEEVWNVPEWKANCLSWEVGSTGRLSRNGNRRPTRFQKLSSYPGNTLSSSNLVLSFPRKCSCGVVLLLVWNLQWALRRSCKPSYVTQDPSERICSSILSTESLRLKRRWDEGKVGSFPGFAVECSWEIVAAEDCVEVFCEKIYARFCRRLRVLFGKPRGS